MKNQWFIGAAAVALTTGAAQAQDAGETEAPFLLADVSDQIVVVGQKRNQSLQDVTASVTVATAEEIAREPIADLYDIIERIPNVNQAFGGLGFSIRGVDQRGIAGNGSTLTVYVDDAPLGNFTTFFGPQDSWDLGQVEVYRGPQSTNFGRNSIAGAIYVRTQDPTYEWDLNLRGEVGNNDAFQGAFAGGGPLVDDVLAFRVSGSWRESDGFVFNNFLNEEADRSELKTGRFKLLFEPTSNFKVITTTSYTENFAGEDVVNPANGVAGALLEPEDVIREVAYDTPGLEGTDTILQSVNAAWTVSDRFEIQSITTFQNTDYVRQEDFDVTPAPIAALDRTGRDRAISEELRLKYSGNRLSGVLGFYFVDTREEFEDDFIIPATLLRPEFPSSILISRASLNATDVRNFAGFLDGEFAVTDRIDLLFGVRYDNEKQTNVAQALTSLASPIPPGFEFIEDIIAELTNEPQLIGATYEAWLPKGGVRWDATDNVTLAFVAQRAYRAGGAEINTINGALQEFDPEFLWNYELSARTTFLDGRLLWNANVYYSDWRDQQVNEPLPPPFDEFSRTVNAGESTLYGFETDVSFALTPDFEVYGGFGYSVAEFDDFENGEFNPDVPVGPANQENFSGNSFPFAPEFSMNAGFDYRHPSGLFGGADVNLLTSSFNDNENFEVSKIDGQTLVNARLGYDVTDQLRVTAYVRNLFDVDYFTFLNREVPGAESGRLGDERTWAVRLDVDL